MKFKLIGFILLLLSIPGCRTRDLRGSYKSSPDGKTYLVIDDDVNGGECSPILVDGRRWRLPTHDDIFPSPSIHFTNFPTERNYASGDMQPGQTIVELLIRYQTQITLVELAMSLWSARRPSLSCSFAALAYTTILSQRQNDADFVDRIGRLRLMEHLSRRGRLMENSPRIMEVPVVLATRENTVEYGLFIGTDIPNSGLTIPFYKGSVEEGYNLPFECAGSAVVRSARISRRDGNVVWLERHLKMTQLFIGLGDQPFAMLLGKPNHGSGENVPLLEGLRCFVFPPGHGIMLHKGVWHDFPLAVKDPVTCLTMNSPEVVEALAGMKEPAEMDHGDVYKIDIQKRTGVSLFVNL